MVRLEEPTPTLSRLDLELGADRPLITLYRDRGTVVVEVGPSPPTVERWNEEGTWTVLTASESRELAYWLRAFADKATETP